MRMVVLMTMTTMMTMMIWTMTDNPTVTGKELATGPVTLEEKWEKCSNQNFYIFTTSEVPNNLGNQKPKNLTFFPWTFTTTMLTIVTGHKNSDKL